MPPYAASALRRPLLLAALALVGLAPGLRADDGAKPSGGAGGAAPPTQSPQEIYEARSREIPLQIAAKFEPAASFAMSNGLKKSGVDIYRTILEFAPDHEKARKETGEDRKGTEWVPNETRQKAIENYEDTNFKKDPELQKKLKEAQVAVSRLLADWGDLAQKAGDEEGAKVRWKRALRFDDQNSAANKGMGNQLVDGKWFSAQALRHRDFQKVYNDSLAKARALPVPIVPVGDGDKTDWAWGCGIKLSGYKSKNFRIESNHADSDVREALTWLERSRQFYIDLFDVPERLLDYSAGPVVFVVVKNQEQHDKLVDACPAFASEKKSFQKKFQGNVIGDHAHLLSVPDGNNLQAESIHMASHDFIGSTFGNPGPWLIEALANAVAAAVKSAPLKVCFSGAGSTGGIHLEHISLDQVPAVLRGLILEKKDNDLAKFVALPADGLSAGDIAKSWSVVMFLLERDRSQAREYFSRAGQGNDGTLSRDDKVLAQFFEAFPNWKALDAAWRDWALDAYRN
jgi:hypothetical protein